MSPGKKSGPGGRQDKRRPGASASPQDHLLGALERFHDAASAAADAWGEDITMQQGLDIMWMLGNIVRDFRVFTAMLSRYQATGADGQPDPELNAPNGQISEASQCLDVARVLTRIGQAAISAGVEANTSRGVPAGGDKDHGGSAVAAAHAMCKALRVFSGIWHEPSGTAEVRDQIVTETMFAMMSMQVALGSLAEGAPKPFDTTLSLIARNFDISCGHLRDSLICSATGNYQPGTENLALEIHEAYPLFSEVGKVELPTARAPGTGAASLAAACFPQSTSDAVAMPADTVLQQGSNVNPIQLTGTRSRQPRRYP